MHGRRRAGLRRENLIIMVSFDFSPTLGGVQSHIYNVSRELIKSGHLVYVVTRELPGIPRVEDIDGIRVFRIACAGKGLGLLRTWGMLVKAFGLFRRARVVCAHDYFTMAGWLLPIRLLLPLKHFSVTFHGYEGLAHPRLRTVLARRFARLLANSSMHVGHFIQKWYGTKPDTVTYGGVPEVYTCSSKLAAAVFVGRLQHDNCVDLYLHGLWVARDRYGLSIPCIIIGDGELSQYAKEFVRRHGLRGVRFLGQTPNAYEYFRSARVAFAGGYLSVLEALKSGCEVICAYRPGIKQDYFGMMPCVGGLWLAPDAESIATALYRIIVLSETRSTNPLISKWVQSQTWSWVTSEYLRMWGVHS